MKQLGKVTQDKAQYGKVLKGLITQARCFIQDKYNTWPCHGKYNYSSICNHGILVNFKDLLASSLKKNVHLSLAEAWCVFVLAVSVFLSASWSEVCQKDHLMLLVLNVLI